MYSSTSGIDARVHEALLCPEKIMYILIFTLVSKLYTVTTHHFYVNSSHKHF